MSLNIKLQLYRGNRANLPATTGLPGVAAYTLDTKELFVDTGLQFMRLAAANQVWTINDPSQLSSLTNALYGDFAIVMAGSPAVLTQTYIFVEQGSPAAGVWVLIAQTEAGGGTDVQGLGSAVAHEFVTFIDNNGVQHLAQPSFADISGTLSQTQLPASIGAGASLTSVDLGTF